MHSLGKRHSWPPLRTQRSSKTPETIDEDPFPSFISSAFEEDLALDSHLSAGISSRTRSHSLPTLYRKSTANHTVPEKVLLRVTRLKIWIRKMERYNIHRSPSAPSAPSPPSPPTVPPVILKDFSTAERGRDSLPSASSRVRNNVRTPPRKPRAWRQPSDNIWPVAEEIESPGEVGLGIMV